MSYGFPLTTVVLYLCIREQRGSSVKPYDWYPLSCWYVFSLILESVKVDIEFRNPLQIPISVSGVSLVCSLSPKTNETTTSGELLKIKSLLFLSPFKGYIFSDG